jgi:hypothetical protein
MEQSRRLILALLVLSGMLSCGGFPAVAAVAQPGPRDSRGVQLGQDPGRPMFVACAASQPCHFLGMVDPSGAGTGAFIVDPGYFTVCSPGVCGTPAPFAATAAFLAGTSVAAAAGGIGGLSAGTVAAIAGTTTAAVVGGVVGGTVAAVTSGPSPVRTGSQ